MRDIRADLRERLEGIATQRLQLDQQESSIKTLLQQEEQRFAVRLSESLTLTSQYPRPVDLSTVIVGVIKDKGPLTSEQLKHAMPTIFDFEGKAPGRVLNFTLQGMRKSGLVDKVEDRWTLKEVAVQ